MNSTLPQNDDKTVDFPALEEMLHELADRSGDAIMPYFRTDLQIDEKDGKGMYDPVTVADRSAEEVMRAHVADRFPEHGIIGEEFGAHNENADLCWIFDPIDGTRAFIIGAPTWGTLMGLLHKKKPLIGMMNQPYTHERFWGGPNGAFWRGPDGTVREMRTSSEAHLANASLATTGPEYFSRPGQFELFTSLSNASRMTRYGYDCYAYCLLAMGKLQLVAEAGLASYDIAPLIPIVEAAGGVVTSWDGGDASNGGTVLASANAELHAKALEVLAV